MKPRRQAVLLDLVGRAPMRNQEQLRRALLDEGFAATQATISRDIKELGLVKRAADGAYQRPDAAAERTVDGSGALARAVGEFVTRLARVQQLVVVRTGPGQAQWVGEAIDRAALAEVVGTIAGDDTILVIARDARRAAQLVRRLEGLSRR